MLSRDKFTAELPQPCRPAPAGGFFNFKDVVLSQRISPTGAHALTPWAHNAHPSAWSEDRRQVALRVQPARLKNRHFLWAFALVVLTHLTHLMAKDDNHKTQWTPPIEPPGSVVVTKPVQAPSAASSAPDRAYTVSTQAALSLSASTIPSTLAEDQASANEATLHQALQQWSQAWTEQAMPQYLAMYASDFQPPKGMSRAAWTKQRTQRITSKQNIRHEMHHLKMQINTDQATVRFTQIYQDERLRATDAKTMHWVFRHGQWQITRETTG